MDISTELSAVATRIEQITGAPVQLPGLPQQAADGAGSFASMLQSQMAAQGSDSSGEAHPVRRRCCHPRKSTRWSTITLSRKTSIRR